MKNFNSAQVRGIGGPMSSRRHALAVMLGAGGLLRSSLSAAETGAPVRLAISESQMGDVNLNDARAAMQIWINRMTNDLSIAINHDSKLAYSSREILDRVRKGELDAVALNIIEYRQLADLLDSSQIISAAGAAGFEQYVILAKRSGAVQRLADLRGRRLCALKAPRMCVAPDWLFTILEEGHFGSAEQFFGSVITDSKASRVVLPVFFGKADASLTSKRSFDTMCELNPQVSKDLTVIASSPAMVVCFYIFRKNYRSVNREKVISALSGLRSSLAGRQLDTLFQFGEIAIRDASCLASALSVLDAADSARGRRSGGSRKG